MALIFVPPVAYANPTTVPERHPGNALFRYYSPRQTGVDNVYLYRDGTATTTPRPGEEPANVFHGGHICPVTPAEAAALAGGGFAVIDTGGT